MTAGAGDETHHLDRSDDLIGAAREIVAASDPLSKVARAQAVQHAWSSQNLSLGLRSARVTMPDRPGRPVHPVLLPPKAMPKRSLGSEKGRIALLHALAHIELNAIDMTWDLIGRFGHEPLPRAFFDDWVRVGAEEAYHFKLISARLEELGAAYGDLPAHDGLWQAAQATGHDLLARVAVVPLVLEARGLDVTPALIDGLKGVGDARSAAVLEVIYRDEKGHVATGMRWFRYLCQELRMAPEPAFHDLVRANFRGPIKPPFNEAARAEAGLSVGFYRPLAATGLTR